jgi:glucose uptake protein
MLLLGGISIAGMAAAFPAGMGCALIVAAFWNFALHPGGNAALLFGGAAVVAGAIVFDILAFKTWSVAKAAQAEAGPGKTRRRKPTLKGAFLSIAGGLLIGSFWPLIQLGRAGENGLGPYSIGVIFAIGILFSTFVFNLFFMNLPVQGKPIEMAEFFKAGLSRHALGVMGGIVWFCGLIASLIGARVEGALRVGAAVSYPLEQGAIVIAALCGVFLWREYAGADISVKIRLGLMFFLLVAGIGIITAGVAAAG